LQRCEAILKGSRFDRRHLRKAEFFIDVDGGIYLRSRLLPLSILVASLVLIGLPSDSETGVQSLGIAKDCETSGGSCYYIEVNGNATAHRAKHRMRKPSSSVVQLF
jgi:hypothetical protein